MGATIFSARWRPSSKLPESVSLQLFPGTAPGRSLPRPSRKRCCIYLSIVGTLLTAVLAPAHSTALSDREEDGLKGSVRSVETRESLLIQTDRYDQQGRLLERVQEGRETVQGVWPLRFAYTYDQSGRRTAEVIRDARGKVVKETRSVYDDRGNRSAELAVWGDGTFENVSLYEYDDAHRRIRALHYNAVQVINRNLYRYDEAGRISRERFERNYRYDAAGQQMVTTDRFDIGYDVAIDYDDRGHVREKVVSDLKGRRQGRSEFRYDERGSQIEERSYDAAGRLTDRKAYRYAYDAVGNWIAEALQWWEVTDGRESITQSSLRERSLSYYDAAHLDRHRWIGTADRADPATNPRAIGTANTPSGDRRLSSGPQPALPRVQVPQHFFGDQSVPGFVVVGISSKRKQRQRIGVGGEYRVQVHYAQVETSGEVEHPIPVLAGQFGNSISLPGGQIDKDDATVPRFGGGPGFRENALEQLQVPRGCRCSTLAKVLEQFGRQALLDRASLIKRLEGLAEMVQLDDGLERHGRRGRRLSDGGIQIAPQRLIDFRLPFE